MTIELRRTILLRDRTTIAINWDCSRDSAFFDVYPQKDQSPCLTYTELQELIAALELFADGMRCVPKKGDGE